MWATDLFHHPAPWIQWGAVLGAALIAACTDLAGRRIPNLLTGPVFVIGLGVAGSVAGWSGVGEALLASIVLSAPFLFLFAFAAGGAGDAKLMGALGAWLGIGWGLIGLVAVCLTGVLLGVLQATYAGRLETVLANVSSMARGFLAAAFSRVEGVGPDMEGRLDTIRASLPPTAPDEGALTMPYGVAIFGGMALTAGGAFLWTV